MATNLWLGGAAAIAWIQYLVPGNVSAGNIFSVTLNSKTISYQTTAGTVADVCTGLAAAIAASTVPGEWKDVTATAASTSTYIALTPTTPGTVIGTITVAAAIGSGTTTPTLTVSNKLTTPVNATFGTAASGGALSNGTYYYRVSAINLYGETLASTETSKTISGGGSAQTVVVNWSQVPGATGYRIYGRSTGAELFIAGVTGETTLTYTDLGSISPSGALPASNTTNQDGSSPNDWNTIANWSAGAVPVSTDDVYIAKSSWDILYNLDQNAVQLNSLNVDLSMQSGNNGAGTIGLPYYNSSGGYIEYRQKYLKIQTSTATFGNGSGSGAGLWMLDFGSATATTTIVNGTGTPTQQGLKALILKGTNAGNILTVNKGSVDIAPFAGETADLSGGLRVGYISNVQSDADVRCGAGVTLSTTIIKTGGILELASNCTALTQSNGVTNVKAGKPATLTIEGGTVNWYTNTTLNTGLTVFGGASLIFDVDPRAKTITPQAVFYKGCIVTDSTGVVTWTGGFKIPDGTLADCTINLGPNRQYTVT